MFTLCIRYTLDPNRIQAFEDYVVNEVPVIRRAGGKIIGYFLPTDFAGPTNIGYGLIEFDRLNDYERYRQILGADPIHRQNAAALTGSGAVLNMGRSFIRRHLETAAI